MSNGEDQVAYGLANEAISKIDDAGMRSAFLAIRSEFYHVWDRMGNKTLDLQRIVAETASQLQLYSRERAAIDRADVQRQESMEHLFRDFVERLDKHLEADSSFQGSVDKRFDGWQRWLIGSLLSIIAALVLGICAFVWQGLKH